MINALVTSIDVSVVFFFFCLAGCNDPLSLPLQPLNLSYLSTGTVKMH